MSVGNFCNREVVFAKTDTSVIEVSKLMRTHHVGDVIIVQASDDLLIPVGIVTDRDIVVELVATEVPYDTLTAEDIMIHDLITAREEDGIWMTLQRMNAKGIKRIPVVNEGGGLEGILTVDDLLELFAEELLSLAKISNSGLNREKETRIES